MAPLGLAIAVGHFKSVIKAKTSSSFLWAWHFTASLIGFITLFCVVVRNGLLLVDNFNWRHQNGEAPMELIRNGSLERLNAMLMTALTSSLGMVPLALAFGAGNEILQPLAIVVLGGLITTTLLTVVVIHALYSRYGRWLLPPAPH